VTRAQLEHLIRAAATIVDDDELIVIGSQSVLGQFPHAPAELRVSDEADIYPRHHPERADLIDGSIGELSPFHRAFGYYAQGVGPTTAVLPAAWQDRLIPVHNERTRGATGWCLEIHDLLISKLVAHREKDVHYVGVAVAHGLAEQRELELRLAVTEIDEELEALVRARIVRAFTSA
jgi:uncharacterized nucleotidyltransferase DUF6036